MGVTGLIGIGFVIVHMAGNLQVFIGQAKLNGYGAMLHGPLAELTWAVRIVLIVSVVLHVHDGVPAHARVCRRAADRLSEEVHRRWRRSRRAR